MKIVINKCYGGYGLSPKALLWLWDKGVRSNAIAADEYFLDEDRCAESLYNWKMFLESKKNSAVFLTAFSPDCVYVLTDHIDRNDPMLVACVETLGEKANGAYADLSVVEIPDDVVWEINEYAGVESIHEVHRVWC